MNYSSVSPPDSIRIAQIDTLQETLELALRYKWVFLGVVALSCIGTYFYTLEQPRVYEADCTIEYDPNPVRPLGREIEDVAQPLMYWTSHEYFQTQNKIIASRAVAERVVARLGLATDPDFMNVPSERRKGWKGATPMEAARALQGRIRVSQDRDTRIVHIKVKDGKPGRAQLLSNALADAYIEKTLEDRLGSTTSALDWLGRQLEHLKSDLERSELELHEFAEQHRDLSLPLEDQKSVLAGTITQLSTTLTETRAQRIQLAARLKELKAANSEDPLSVHAGAIESNPTISGLRAKYFEAVAKRDALAVEFGEAHPQIRAVTTEIDRLRSQMRDEIDGAIQAAESSLREIKTIETGLHAALDEANETGLQLNLKEITYRRLERERNNTAKLYGAILERTTETDLTQALEVSYVRIVDRAVLPVVPVSPKLRNNLVVGALLGLAMAMVVALLLMRMDRTIRTADDAERLGITILGILPKIDGSSSIQSAPYARRQRKPVPEVLMDRDLVVHKYPQSSVAECCRTIRTNLMFMSADKAARTITVTSANPREGKTTVAMSLAIVMAQSGKRVLIVDTDLRKPRVHRALGIDASRGVTSVLVGQHSLDKVLQETEIPNLWALPSGPIPPNPSELLHSAQFGDLVKGLADRFDTVIFDSSPLGAVTDAAIIARAVDGAIVVIQSQKTSRDALRSSLRQLHDVNATILGSVLNNVDLSARHYGAGSYYYYHSADYYAAFPDEEADSREIPAAES